MYSHVTPDQTLEARERLLYDLRLRPAASRRFLRQAASSLVATATGSGSFRLAGFGSVQPQDRGRHRHHLRTNQGLVGLGQTNLPGAARNRQSDDSQ